ncbi:MAG: cation-translocating P-type ATPase [Patescibacteria group bacterium]
MAGKKAWHNFSVEQVLGKLMTSENGLTGQEGEKRLLKFGLNKIEEEKPFSAIKLLSHQFKSVLILILVIAAIISAFLNEWLDVSVIIGAVMINVAVGFLQEYKAQRALSELKKVLKPRAIVFRGGNKIDISAEELVPGDIVYLEAGNQVPADVRLLEVNQFQTQEAILTGESEAVIKSVELIKKESVITAEKKNMAFMGTLVSQGTALAVVVETGMSTEIGKIARMLKAEKDEKTPFQLQLQKFGRKIGTVLIFLAVMIFVFGIISGRGVSEIFQVSVASAVSAIPEGLPVAVTVILAIGMQRILKKKSLVRKLVAAETLGSTSVICVDKTGTITTGVMKLEKISTHDRDLTLNKKRLIEPEKFLFLAGALCNNAAVSNPEENKEKWRIIGSPTEKAILEGALAQNIDFLSWQKEYPRISELPFAAKYRMMFTIHKFSDEKNRIFCKGAPENVMELCQYYLGDKQVLMTGDIRRYLQEKYLAYSQKGYRVLAAAYQDQDNKIKQIIRDKKYVFLGFYIIRDQLRPGVKQIVKDIKRAGIKMVMITGDHELTAKAVAKEIGLNTSAGAVMNGETLARMSDEALAREIDKISVFARVSPRDKFKIVNAYQRIGQVVAMTGDGVNDAPALKTADVGIAVGGGSEITKQTADLILLDNRLSTIVDAIGEGRVIFQNIKKVIVYLLANSFSEIILIFGSLLLGLPLPLTAAQILWINLVTDSLPAASLTLEKNEPGIMRESPIPRGTKIMDREMLSIIFIIGLLTDIIIFGLFYWQYSIQTVEISQLRTFIFATLGLGTLFIIFSCRSLKLSILKIKFWTNKWLLGAVALGALTIVLPIYIPALSGIFDFVPLDLNSWLLLLTASIIRLIGIEIVKYIFVKKNGRFFNRFDARKIA